MGQINISSINHHQKYIKAMNQYNSLIAIDTQKALLMSNLQLIMQRTEIMKWQDEFHPGKLSFLNTNFKLSPLILLSGDVGCGKTELANCIGSPLAEKLNVDSIKVYEMPSDVRGTGHVGELSARIKEVFDQVIADVNEDEAAILIIDEADALANSREADQQHHEDRAGVNTLIKELDRIEKLNKRIAVLFITNRSAAMDPAILRRVAVEIQFQRPGEAETEEVIRYLLQDIPHEEEQIQILVKECLKKSTSFTFSDLFKKIAHQSVIKAFEAQIPLNFSIVLDTIQRTKPSPIFKES